jgi:hypothetical protein
LDETKAFSVIVDTATQKMTPRRPIQNMSGSIGTGHAPGEHEPGLVSRHHRKNIPKVHRAAFKAPDWSLARNARAR